MNIAIDIRSVLKKTRTGVGQYTYNLINDLALIDGKNQYFLYAKINLFSRDKKLPEINADNFKFKIDRFSKGLEKTLGEVDIYHSPSQDLLEIDKAKIIVTIHDLIFKTYPAGLTRDALNKAEKQLLNALSKSDKIICYSQSTVLDLKRFYDVKGEKIRLIYAGINRKDFSPLESSEIEKAKNRLKNLGIANKFILFVGTIEPRKNIANLISAFNNLKKQKNIPHKLVIVGMKGWLYEEIFDLYNKSEFKDDIMFLDYQPNNTLKDFYNLADVFVYPSFYEGFGFPIVEAFSCGCAVVTSNVSSCKEIAGDAALLVDPNSVYELSEAIFKILNDSNLKRQLMMNGIERSKKFSWQDMAIETLEVYKEVFNED